MGPSFPRHIAIEIAGLAAIALALFTGLALLSYSPADAPFRFAPVANRAGPIGATLAHLLRGGLGYGSVVAAAVVGWLGAGLLLGRAFPRIVSRASAGTLLLMASLAALPEGLRPLWPSAFAEGAGGSVGEWLAALAVSWLGAWGGLLAISGAFALGVLYVTGIPAEAALRVVTLLARAAAAGVFALALGLVRLGDGVRRIASRSAAAAARAASGVGPRLRGVARALSVWREQRARRRRVAAEREREAALPLPPAPFEPPGPGEVEAAAPEAEPPSRRRAAEPTIIDHRSEGRRGEPRQETFAFREPPPRGAFRLPDPGIFERAPGGARSYDRDSLIMNSRILEKKLRDFGVLGRVVAVHPGPVITMYEFEPASGIKVNRITNLADDLALAMRALSVRIIAPLPGKSVVGIEVPNPQREVVYLGELVSASSFQTSASKLTIALGKDIFGNPVETVLARMPHLLVAGATGTGKSVFLNALLCSLLSRATPDELRLLLIDPKLLELSIYEGIPHLIADVVTNPKRAAAALGGIVRKMEERYQMMAALGVRSIVQFNERVEQELAAGVRTFHLKAKPGEEQGLEVEFRKLPYIVVVIDELADLMVVSARDVEEALQRLAQMARAAGIHLVLATQRPSVDVLTGVIKANFPARISFQVSSRTDSRTILDQNGAEHLLGQGDMLFLPPGTSKLQRIHGAYVSEKEVSELVAFLRDQGRPEFDDSLLRMNEESEEQDAGGEEVDDLYDRAIAIVAETRNASISYLQRRLKVGYNRAARMIEQMEADRIVGPQDGTKPREVYARPVDVE